MTWKLSATWNLDPLPSSDQPSVAYALVDVTQEASPESTPTPVSPAAPQGDEPQSGQPGQTSQPTGLYGSSAPLNLNLVLDTSGSMGGVKLHNLKEAVKWVINHLSAQDTLSVTLFDEEVNPLMPVTGAEEARGKLAQIDAIREANGTAMSKGLEVGLDEALKGRTPGAVSRIILLTDGQTWGDAERCKELAARAGAEGIPITALGVGADEDWSVELLDDIATNSGGQSGYIAKPEEIANTFRGTVAAMQQTVASNTRMLFVPSSGVTARAIYRVAPVISKLWPPETPEGAAAAAPEGNSITLPLGDMQSQGSQTFLYELLVPPRMPGQFRLARVLLRYESTDRPQTEEETALDLAAKFAVGARRGPGNPRVMNSVEKATTFKLQTRALQASMIGDVTNATRNLRAAATRLLNMGETELADAAESEAQLLESQGQMSAAGTKKLAFETRKLAVQETDNTKAATVRFEDNP